MSIISAIPSGSSGGGDLGCSYASYMAFCQAVSLDSIDAAIGKNHGSGFHGLGLALAMYAKYKEPSISIQDVFSNLLKCQSYMDINEESLAEINSNPHILELVSVSPFAQKAFAFVSPMGIEITNSGVISLSDLCYDGSVDICLIGAGGHGGAYNSGGGGGGGGGYMTNVFDVTTLSDISVTVALKNNQNTSVIVNNITYTANSGSNGKPGNQGGTGGDGGSGGGGGATHTGTSDRSYDRGGDGGSNGSNGLSSKRGRAGGTGDNQSKFIFGDAKLPLCCGGGAGGASGFSPSGAGGAGGGAGREDTNVSGIAGTYYGGGGSGGGALGSNSGAGGEGYQGAVFIRKHRN